MNVNSMRKWKKKVHPKEGDLLPKYKFRQNGIRLEKNITAISQYTEILFVLIPFYTPKITDIPNTYCHFLSSPVTL